jgi:hypothetical protein
VYTTENKYIVFRIGSYPLALPVDRILKIVTCPDHLGQLLRDVWLAQMGQRMVLIMNLHQSFLPKNEADLNDNFGRFLLMVRGKDGEICGIPLDEPPNLEDIPASIVQDVPPSYYQVGLPEWIAQIAILNDQSKTSAILMLDIDRALTARARILSAEPTALKALQQVEPNSSETPAMVELAAL